LNVNFGCNVSHHTVLVINVGDHQKKGSLLLYSDAIDSINFTASSHFRYTGEFLHRKGSWSRVCKKKYETLYSTLKEKRKKPAVTAFHAFSRERSNFYVLVGVVRECLKTKTKTSRMRIERAMTFNECWTKSRFTTWRVFA